MRDSTFSFIRCTVVAFGSVLSISCSDDPVNPSPVPATHGTPTTSNSPPSPSPGGGFPAPGAQGSAETLLISADTICLQAVIGGADARPDDVRITAPNGQLVRGLAAAVEYPSGGPTGWLATRFDQDSTPARLWLAANSGALVVGEYVARVVVTAGGGEAARPITVVLKVGTSALKALVVKDLNLFVGDIAPGSGVVQGPGIDCRNGTGDCIEYYPVGTAVTLTARTDSTSFLVHWLDACADTPESSPCTLVITDSTTVRTWFGLHGSSVHLSVGGSGATGGVYVNQEHGAPIYCMVIDGVGSECNREVLDGTIAFELTAVANFGNRFAGWTGACSGTQRCLLAPSPGGTYDAGATFERDPAIGNVLRVVPVVGPPGSAIQLRVAGGGLDCRANSDSVSGTCETTVPVGATVTLSATASPNVTFNWSWTFTSAFGPSIGPECPASAADCTITMNGPRELRLSAYAAF